MLPGERIEIKRLDGGTAQRGAPFDAQVIPAPAEMVPPKMSTGIEEVDLFSR